MTYVEAKRADNGRWTRIYLPAFGGEPLTPEQVIRYAERVSERPEYVDVRIVSEGVASL